MAHKKNKSLVLLLGLALLSPAPAVFSQTREISGEAQIPVLQGVGALSAVPGGMLSPSLSEPALLMPSFAPISAAASLAAPVPAAASIPAAAASAAAPRAAAPLDHPVFAAARSALAAPSDGPSAPRAGEDEKSAAGAAFDSAGTGNPLDDSALAVGEPASSLRPSSGLSAAPVFDPDHRPASLADRIRDRVRYHTLMSQSFWWYMYTHIGDMWPGYKSRWAKTRGGGDVAVSRPRAFFTAMRVTGMSGRFYMLGGSALEDDLVIDAFRRAFARYFDGPGIGARERAALEGFMQRAKGFNAERRSHTNMYKNIRDPLIKASTMPPDRLAAYFDGLMPPEKEISTKEYQSSGQMDRTREAFLAVLRRTLDEEDPHDAHRVRAGIVLGSFASGSAGPGSDFDVEALADGASNARRESFVKRLTDHWIAAGYHETNPVTVHDRTSWPSWGLVNIVQTRHYIVVSPEPALVARLSRQAFEDPAVRLERSDTFHGRVNRLVQRGIVAVATYVSDVKAAFGAKPSSSGH
jgi:hypothetical protein